MRILVRTYPVTDLNTHLIQSEGCFKIKVRNASTGCIYVEGCPIEPGQCEVFDGLFPGDSFDKDFELNVEEAISPEIYITRYFYAPPKAC